MSRSQRRVAVTGCYLGYAALGTTWCLAAGRPDGLDWAVVILAGVVSLAALFAVWRGAGGLILASAHLLDERQRAVRDRAFRIAYLIVSVVFLAAALLYSRLALRATAGGPVAYHDLLPLGIGAVLITLTLPLAVVAWTEPDPPEDSGTFTKTAQ